MSDTMKLDLPILLPGAPDASDACVGRLISLLRDEPGVSEVHVVEDAAASRLCIHYDPDRLTLAEVRRRARAAGAEITGRYGHLVGWLDGVRHARHARTIEAVLAEHPGVLEAVVDPSGAVRLEFERDRLDRAEIDRLLAVHKLGFSDTPLARTTAATPERKDARKHAHAPGEDHDHGHGPDDGHGHAHGGFLGPNTELIFALTSGAALAFGFLLEWLAPDLPAWLPLALYLTAYGFGGFFTVGEAIENLRRKRFEIDTLMLVAAAGAAALGAWAEGALLLFLFSLGHALEHYAMGRAKRAIEALAELAPRTAHVRRDGQVVELPVEDLVVGDIVIVRPNERLPADGFVVAGSTSINQAPVTGESMPIDKQAVSDPGEARARPASIGAASVVFAGTINGSGAIEIETTRKSSDTTLAKVVRMVSEAETQKSPTQRFTDRFERIFVPLVLALAFVLLFAWVVVDEPFRDSFYRAMAVLVAASPCALAIATPSAVLSGVARAARAGVLIKGGAPLENLGSLDAIAFDKTGTLTEGQPRITDVAVLDGVEEAELLSVAVAVERLSDHPLAAAISRDGAERLKGASIPQASALQSLTGKGVTAQLGGEPVWIGKPEMFGADGLAPLTGEAAAAVTRLRDQGRTLMVVRKGNRDLGVIGLLDTPRAAARPALEVLRALGVKRMIMISGDHQKAAEAIAGQVGLTEAWGDLMPEDKVDAIKKLRAEAKVAMVGDGVNDAPAMATATVGVAMGAAGSDVALETADVALMGDDLSQLPFTVGLSRQTRRIILQNLVVSLGIVAFLVPATVLGLGIGPAVALHEGSTLLVVFNALRLLGYRDRAHP
ncbi:heavy metal translocating P-type ATPase [Sandaracinobacter sp. RS1-74]|uniref:heavy metal translocating P-type ATPase n=1 Tax=Sandaracinobacteroides sayramensis TaxID=2913411 RepID=UPI001EDAC9E1|nr:heavy metal translocating P-type ATPase [Sandaracinobacteroides sayramensis]MCG2841480.1 heavy metal translocating P-type ATPase [Sandaracinobacteroides sayramensis]